MNTTDALILKFQQSPGGSLLSELFSQRIDEILFDLLLYVGWVPIAMVIVYGLLEVWKDWRQTIWVGKQEYVLLAINVPKDSEQSPKAVENIFTVCSGATKIPNFKDKWIEGQERRIFSFELVAIDGYIQYYIWVCVRYRDMIESAIYAQYPDAEIFESEDYTKNVPDEVPHDDWEMSGDEYRLIKPEYLPLRTWPEFEHSLSQELKDPLAVLLESLSKLRVGEQSWIQIIVIPTLDKWKEAGEQFIKETYGIKEEPKKSTIESLASGVMSVPKAILDEVTGMESAGSEDKPGMDTELFKMFKVTEAEKELAKAVYRKISRSGFKCKIRYVYIARKEVYNRKFRNDAMKGYFRQFAHLDMNALFTHPKVGAKSDYFWHHWVYHKKLNNIFKCYKSRAHIRGATSFVLNVEELATLWHFPSIEIKAPLIQKTVSRRAEPPPQLSFAGEEEEFAVSPGSVQQAKQKDLVEDAPSASNLSFEIEGVDDVVEEEPEAGTIASPFINTEQEEPDLPGVDSPTAKSVVEPLKPATPTKPEEPAGQQNVDIPDALKVLIAPGVEPEDVGIETEVEDKKDDAPTNLFS
jgi:hypothetical protein